MTRAAIPPTSPGGEVDRASQLRTADTGRPSAAAILR